jgi:hypothetical protein
VVRTIDGQLASFLRILAQRIRIINCATLQLVLCCRICRKNFKLLQVIASCLFAVRRFRAIGLLDSYLPVTRRCIERAGCQSPSGRMVWVEGLSGESLGFLPHLQRFTVLLSGSRSELICSQSPAPPHRHLQAAPLHHERLPPTDGAIESLIRHHP